MPDTKLHSGSEAGQTDRLQPPVLLAGERRLDYLRLSITDLCNLRCRYCMPPEGVPKLRREEVLTYEELLRLCAVFSALGGRKLRLTGGEPLLRRNLLWFLNQLNEAALFEELRLTTNGLLLAPLAPELRRLGVLGVNLSLDALDPGLYATLTGHPGPEGRRSFQQAWAGFEAALACGLQVKVNCVPLKGVNESEISPLAALSLKYPVEIRFIEHMPIGRRDLWRADRVLSSERLLAGLEQDFGPLTPLPPSSSAATARLYQIPGASGRLGLISPLSRHFCGTCNRLRLTADGKLKPCLLTGQELDLAGPLRAGADDEQLAAIFRSAAALKPDSHLGRETASGDRDMSRIGG